MNHRGTPLSALPNLGVTVLATLRASGVTSRAQLARLGSVAVYQRLCATAGRRLPRCYYLYSLEAALRGVHWRSLPEATKRQLARAASHPNDRPQPAATRRAGVRGRRSKDR